MTYDPESESIQHTREKLQQRRMDVARRLRKLAQERAPDVDDSKLGLSLSSVTSADTVYLMPNVMSKVGSGLKVFCGGDLGRPKKHFCRFKCFIHIFINHVREKCPLSFLRILPHFV